jgi:hypothetical protein
MKNGQSKNGYFYVTRHSVHQCAAGTCPLEEDDPKGKKRWSMQNANVCRNQAYEVRYTHADGRLSTVHGLACSLEAGRKAVVAMERERGEEEANARMAAAVANAIAVLREVMDQVDPEGDGNHCLHNVEATIEDLRTAMMDNLVMDQIGEPAS